MASEDYFQRLTAGATYSRTFDIFTKRLYLFLPLSLLVFVPLAAINITLVGYIGSSTQTFLDTMEISNRYLQQTYFNEYSRSNNNIIVKKATEDMLPKRCFGRGVTVGDEQNDLNCQERDLECRLFNHHRCPTENLEQNSEPLYSSFCPGKTRLSCLQLGKKCQWVESARSPLMCGAVPITVMDSSSNTFDPNFDPDAAGKFLAGFINIALQLIIETLVFLIVVVCADAAIIYAVGQMYVDRNPHISECLLKGFSKWCTLLGASLLVAIGLLGAYFVMILIPAILIQISEFLGFIAIYAGVIAWFVFANYVLVSLIILSPAIVIENFGPIDSIKRAWDLSKNNRCYIFCTLFCFGLIYNILILIINSIISSVAGQDATFSAGGVFIAMLPVIIYHPLYFILKTVVYLNIRVQFEGMNRGVLVNDLDGILAGEAGAALCKTEGDKAVPLIPTV